MGSNQLSDFIDLDPDPYSSNFVDSNLDMLAIFIYNILPALHEGSNVTSWRRAKPRGFVRILSPLSP